MNSGPPSPPLTWPNPPVRSSGYFVPIHHQEPRRESPLDLPHGHVEANSCHRADTDVLLRRGERHHCPVWGDLTALHQGLALGEVHRPYCLSLPQILCFFQPYIFTFNKARAFLLNVSHQRTATLC